VRLLRVNGEHFVFHIGSREKRLLFQVLDLYPLLNSDYHQISQSGSGPKLEASQELLREAMSEQRAKHRKQLDLILKDERWLKQDENGYRFNLSPHQVDWLLQVLNDIRVGAWHRLGCPEEYRRTADLTPETARYLAAMEFSAYFQSILLSALEEMG
jgi:hypothetical protein